MCHSVGEGLNKLNEDPIDVAEKVKKSGPQDPVLLMLPGRELNKVLWHSQLTLTPADNEIFDTP